MISRIKEFIKTSMSERKIEEYYRDLDEQFVSYHDWITIREMQYRDTMNEEYAEENRNESAGREKQNEYGTGDYLLYVTDDAFLDDHAVEVIDNYFKEYPECCIVYGDEDEWNSNRTIRMNPWFKPDFSPELLEQYFYFGNVVAIRKAYVKELVSDFELTLSKAYEICLKAAATLERGSIGHVPYVLYHAPMRVHLCEEEAYDPLRYAYLQDVKKNRKPDDKISIVIPSKDNPEILKKCIESVISTSKETNYEITVVDNGSAENTRKVYEEMSVKFGFNYIYEPMDFHFSRMCNLGAARSTGDILLFLNDDIEAVENGWIEKMKYHVVKKHVGSVGAKLYYFDSKTIQHAGITNLRLGPVHKLQFMEDVRPYYDGRNGIDHNVLAVTGACLMVRREVFDECGGFSKDLAVAFNDVELCFRCYKKGYYNVICNTATLYHHESLSRGEDTSKEKLLRLQNERDRMYAMHPDLYGRDPFYHPYLNTVILDTNYSFAYEYPAGADVAIEEPMIISGELKEEWYNNCLQISLEYAGELTGWMEGPGKSGEYLYFQGYQFVMGSENPSFDRFLLCREETTGQIWEIPCIPTFRPDLERNLKEGHGALCGFAFVIEKKLLPKGIYSVGGMAKSRISRLVLCKFTNKFVEVSH